jgi:hypothetical protein
VTTGRKIRIKGYRPDKSGKLIVKDPKHLDASARAKLKGGVKVKYGRRGGK